MLMIDNVENMYDNDVPVSVSMICDVIYFA